VDQESKELRLAQTGKTPRSFKISDDIRGELKRTGELIEKGKQNWRKVLQDHGNKKREEDQGYWINKVIGRISEADIGDDKVVIDGFRNLSGKARLVILKLSHPFGPVGWLNAAGLGQGI